MNTQPLRAALSPPLLLRPIAPDCVRAGFPSPAQDYEQESLDINRYLVRNAPATFYVEVEGESMSGAGIHSGDVLVVDKSITPQSGHIVIAFVEGERFVKRLLIAGDVAQLVAEHPGYAPVSITAERDVVIWGVVVGRFARVKA